MKLCEVIRDMLKESSVAKLKTLPKDAIKIEVGYPSIFAPSEELLSEFNELKWKFMKKGMTEPEARRNAWEQIHFEKRYRKKVTTNLEILHKLREIKKLSKTKDVYLYCYCGKKPCHRFILLDIVKKMKGEE